MSRALAVRLQPDAALVAVVHGGESRAIHIEAARRIALDPGDDPAARGRVISAALSDLRLGRLPAVVVVPRSETSVQTYDLPPAPAEDLPDLVHLQAQRDLALAEGGEGFDFLPLAGSDSEPYRVVGMGMSPTEWKSLRETCDAADLKADRIVPEPLGWPELGRRVVDLSEDTHLLHLFAAIVGRQAVVWASVGESLRLIRGVWLPEDDNAAADAAALGGDLRRTLLALGQSHPEHRGGMRCVYIGENADEIAGELGATLSKPVHAVPLEGLLEAPSVDWSDWSLTEMAPLAALACAAAQRRGTPMDLLHPRRRPAPPSRLRTYVLAATAAALLVGALAWGAYCNIQSPLDAADAARAEQEAMAPLLKSLAADETKAAAVRGWLGDSVNLLTELDYLGQQLRPAPLDSEEFKPDQDVVLTKLTVTNQQITLDAAAKSNEAIQPTEARLRAASYRVDRGPVAAAEGVPGYAVKVTDTIQRVDAAGTTQGAAP